MNRKNESTVDLAGKQIEPTRAHETTEQKYESLLLKQRSRDSDYSGMLNRGAPRA